MKALKITLFLIGTIIISTQTFNHIFVKFIEPRFSITDNYKEDFEKEIDRSESLRELEKMYKPVIESINNIKKSNPDYRNSDEYKELKSKKEELERVIQRTESILIEKKKVIFYWLFGLFSISAGIFIHSRISSWIGISAIITGFCEMITWTSPLYHSHVKGYYEVITLKLVFSIFTLILIILLWLMNRKYLDKDL